MDEKYVIEVYIKVDENNNITSINSSIFITNTNGWILVDSGNGDRYAHAQNLYLEKPIMDENGCYNYKYIDNKIVQYTDEEKRLFDLDDILSSKIAEIKKMCESAIVAGVDADVLDRGLLHYSLTQTKQDDIKVLMTNIQNGTTAVLWHDDSRVMHEIYTADQFTELYNIIFEHIITCKITSDGLEQYATDLAEAEDIDTLISINWDTELPDYIQEQVDEQIMLMIENS